MHWSSTLVGLLAIVALHGCGARSRGKDPPRGQGLPLVPLVFDGAGEVVPRCEQDSDCLGDACASRACVETFCVEVHRVECAQDDDPCTKHECDPATGSCAAVHATPDEDGDGHRAPLPGLASTDGAACGDDCDDTHAGSHPGGTEVCDGHDNDCDGTIDEGFAFVPPAAEAVRVSEGAEEAGLGGLVHDGERFVLSYSGRTSRNETMLLGLRRADDVEFRTSVALTNSDNYAGPVRFTGSSLVTAWEDRRDDDFEIYFNRFSRTGEKLGPDLRLSTAPDFSLNPALLAIGETHVVFWQDRRDRERDFQIHAQRVEARGELLGENVNVTEDHDDSEAPSVVAGEREIGLVFNTKLSGRQVVFKTVSFELDAVGRSVVVSGENSVGASVSFNAGTYVVLWHVYDATPGDAIWGSVLDPEGNVRVPAARVTEPAEFARGHDALALGDRILLLFTQFVDGSYDLFLRTLAPDLSPLDDAVQLTSTEGDVLGAAMAAGDGQLGIAFSSYRSGTPQVYFTTLACR